MLFVKNITKIVKLGIASSFIRNEEPVSVILLGNPEIGKSSILLRFNTPKNVFFLTDLTKSKLENLIKEFQNIRYLIIPDFIKIISHSKSTVSNLISLLNACIEEGVREITQYFGGSVHQTTPFKKPIKFGLATAMTRDSLEDRRRNWHRIGFFSRLMPVSFRYTKEQAKKIREYIYAGKDLFEKKEKLRLKPTTITCSKKYPAMFEEYIDQFADANRLYGFRLSKQIRGLLKANALLRGSRRVTIRDVKEVKKLLKWINLEYNYVE